MFSDYLILSATALASVVIIALACLKGWQGWLALQGRVLDQSHTAPRGSPEGAARIEMADLKERIRKLEAIAAGVDL